MTIKATSLSVSALLVLVFLVPIAAIGFAEEKIYEVEEDDWGSNTIYVITAHNTDILDNVEFEIKTQGIWNVEKAFLRVKGDDEKEWIDVTRINEHLDNTKKGAHIIVEPQEQWVTKIRNSAPRVSRQKLEDFLNSALFEGAKGVALWEAANTNSLEINSRAQVVELGDTGVSDPQLTGGEIYRTEDPDGKVVLNIRIDNSLGGSGPGGVPTEFDCALRLLSLVVQERTLAVAFLREAYPETEPGVVEQEVNNYRNKLVRDLTELNAAIAAGMVTGLELLPIIGNGVGIGVAVDDLENGEYLSAALNVLPILSKVLGTTGKAVRFFLKNKSGKFVEFGAEQGAEIGAIMRSNLTDEEKMKRITDICTVVQLIPFLRKIFCFPAGTKISTPNGLVAIESLRGGYVVNAYDEIYGTQTTSVLEDVRLLDSRELVTIQLFGPQGDEIVETTPEHPFLDARGGKWIKAEDLRPGDRLASGLGHASVVKSVASSSRSLPVYSLQLATYFSYFVGENEVVVHNSCWGPVSKTLRKDFGGSLGKGIAVSTDDSQLAERTLKQLKGVVADKKGEEALKDAMRAGLGHGSNHHEWIPLRLAKYVLEAGYSREEREIFVALWAHLRSHTSVIKFTNKPLANGEVTGHVASKFYNTGGSDEFHDGLEAIVKRTLPPGSVNRGSVKTMLEEMEDFSKDFFKEEELMKIFGPRMTTEAGVGRDALTKIYETEKNVTNGGKYYGLHTTAALVFSSGARAVLDSDGIRPP